MLSVRGNLLLERPRTFVPLCMSDVSPGGVVLRQSQVGKRAHRLQQPMLFRTARGELQQRTIFKRRVFASRSPR